MFLNFNDHASNCLNMHRPPNAPLLMHLFFPPLWVPSQILFYFGYKHSKRIKEPSQNVTVLSVASGKEKGRAYFSTLKGRDPKELFFLWEEVEKSILTLGPKLAHFTGKKQTRGAALGHQYQRKQFCTSVVEK